MKRKTYLFNLVFYKNETEKHTFSRVLTFFWRVFGVGFFRANLSTLGMMETLVLTDR